MNTTMRWKNLPADFQNPYLYPDFVVKNTNWFNLSRCKRSALLHSLSGNGNANLETMSPMVSAFNFWTNIIVFEILFFGFISIHHNNPQNSHARSGIQNIYLRLFLLSQSLLTWCVDTTKLKNYLCTEQNKCGVSKSSVSCHKLQQSLIVSTIQISFNKSRKTLLIDLCHAAYHLRPSW